MSETRQEIPEDVTEAATEEATEALAEQGGFMDLLLYWLDRLTDPIIEAVTQPVVVDSLVAVLAGMLIAVFVFEWLKRFAQLKPFTWVFEGQHTVSKMRLVSALIAGALAAAMGPDGFKASLITFVTAAVASPTVYDLAYKLAPAATERVLKRVRGDK